MREVKKGTCNEKISTKCFWNPFTKSISLAMQINLMQLYLNPM